VSNQQNPKVTIHTTPIFINLGSFSNREKRVHPPFLHRTMGFTTKSTKIMFFSLHVLHKLPKRSRSLQIARVTPCRNAETLETFAKEHQAMTSFSRSSRPAVDPFRNEETMIKSNWNCHVNIIIVSYCISISKHYNVTISLSLEFMSTWKTPNRQCKWQRYVWYNWYNLINTLAEKQ